MTTPLHQWATRWHIPPEAVRDLQITLGLVSPPVLPVAQGKSEAWVQSVVRLEASKRGVLLFRNNVGALRDETGRVIRFGLANDSSAMNGVIKSSDLVGQKSVMITESMVGTTIGQFTSRECKSPGWKYTGTPREVAQLAWITLINSRGGDAKFTDGGYDGSAI